MPDGLCFFSVLYVSLGDVIDKIHFNIIIPSVPRYATDSPSDRTDDWLCVAAVHISDARLPGTLNLFLRWRRYLWVMSIGLASCHIPGA